MRWEEQECWEDDCENWIVGDDKSWLAEVFMNFRKKTSEIEFDVFSFPRHIVEDSGWKTLRDAIESLKIDIKEMERLDAIAKKLGVKIISDEFIGFRAILSS